MDRALDLQEEMDINDKERPPSIHVYSALLGIPFVGGWLGIAATVAADGREPVIEWLDPMLAGLTLATILVAQLALMFLWPRLSDSRFRIWISWGLIISEWSYIFGEVLSNTMTIGEPPIDIGLLFEIGAGVLLFPCSIGLSVLYARATDIADASRARANLSVFATVFFIGLLWWLTHPIIQSQAGAPPCVPGNPLSTPYFMTPGPDSAMCLFSNTLQPGRQLHDPQAPLLREQEKE
jgi:hypothetical protein